MRSLKMFHLMLALITGLLCVRPMASSAAAFSAVVEDALWIKVYLPMTVSVNTPQIVFESGRDGNSEIYSMDGRGSGQVNLTNHPSEDYNPVWAPDGARIAFESYRDGGLQIYSMNADGSGQTRLTEDSANMAPAWSPDGQWIAYVSMRDGNAEIYRMSASGAYQENLSRHDGRDSQPDWSPNGQGIVFVSARHKPAGELADEICVVNPDGSNLRCLTSDGLVHRNPVWSPDSQRIAYEAGGDLMVMNADGSGQMRLTPEGIGGGQPSWSPDGRYIAFVYRKDGLVGVGVIGADGSNLTLFEATPVEDHGWEVSKQGAWAPDGMSIVYTRIDAPICSLQLSCRINRIAFNGLYHRVLTVSGDDSRAAWQP